MRFLSLIILLTILTSSCKTHRQGCGPDIGYYPHVQTVTVQDTEIVVVGTSFDTIVSLQSRDTIIIRDEKTRIETRIVKLPGDSIFIEPICPPDTVVVTKVKIETVQEKLVEAVGGKWKKHLMIAAVAVVGLFAVGYAVNALKR